MEQIIHKFNSLKPIQQVIVYAEALKAERYELLTVIDKTIPQAAKKEFLRSVELWNT